MAHNSQWQLFLSAILQKLKADVAVLQDSKVWQLAKQKLQEAEKLVNDALSKVLSLKNGTLR